MLRSTASLPLALALSLSLGCGSGQAPPAPDPDNPQAQKPAGDEERLRGAWRVVSSEAPGFFGKGLSSIKPRFLTGKGDSIVFADGRLTHRHPFYHEVRPGHSSADFACTLDPSATPPAIDLTVPGWGKGSQPMTVQGIYRLEGETLELCFEQDPRKARPTEFKAPGDSTLARFTLKRRPSDSDPAERARREASQNNLKAIGEALHRCATRLGGKVNRSVFPMWAIFEPGQQDFSKRRPLLSWRVAILPDLGYAELYQHFKLDQPWDSAHNKPLLEKIPKEYAPPSDQTKGGLTPYQGFVGKGAFFEPHASVSVFSITRGTTGTVALAEAAEGVPWTKPADLACDPKGPLPRLGGLFKDGFHVVMVSGDVFFFRQDFDETQLRRAIQRSSDGIVNWEGLLD